MRRRENGYFSLVHRIPLNRETLRLKGEWDPAGSNATSRRALSLSLRSRRIEFACSKARMRAQSPPALGSSNPPSAARQHEVVIPPVVVDSPVDSDLAFSNSASPVARVLSSPSAPSSSLTSPESELACDSIDVACFMISPDGGMDAMGEISSPSEILPTLCNGIGVLDQLPTDEGGL